ncbi:mitochondrial ribosomal protein L31-domain-containing protein, partial [Naematelia encephala]
WRMTPTRKANQRARMKTVDSVIAAVVDSGIDAKSVRKAITIPKEHEMDARDKYFTYAVKGRNFRKGVHHVPKFTRVSQAHPFNVQLQCKMR